MTDTDLRTLGRAHEATPADEGLLARLQAARLRAGLGWHGEVRAR